MIMNNPAQCLLKKKFTDNKIKTMHVFFNPKGCGGFSIGCHFSQDDAMVTKILDFIHIHPK